MISIRHSVGDMRLQGVASFGVPFFVQPSQRSQEAVSVMKYISLGCISILILFSPPPAYEFESRPLPTNPSPYVGMPGVYDKLAVLSPRYVALRIDARPWQAEWVTCYLVGYM